MGFRLYKVEVRLSLGQQKTPHVLLWRVRSGMISCPLSIGFAWELSKDAAQCSHSFPFLGETLVRYFLL